MTRSRFKQPLLFRDSIELRCKTNKNLKIIRLKLEKTKFSLKINKTKKKKKLPLLFNANTEQKWNLRMPRMKSLSQFNKNQSIKSRKKLLSLSRDSIVPNRKTKSN